MKNKIKFIAFDADDTLWVNELFFYEFEARFCTLIKEYLPTKEASKVLFDTEMKNLHLYGYGVKGMVLCMIEVICKTVAPKDIANCVNVVIELGKDLLQKPIDLIDGVAEVLAELSKKYKLVLATKGDLLDQERKVIKSGLAQYFHHIEIMSDKQTADYSKLIQNLGCKPNQFLMIGNSVKSDILPVLELDGFAAHVPYAITWQHEKSDQNINHNNLVKLNQIREILNYL